jgi:predicted membrane protein
MDMQLTDTPKPVIGSNIKLVAGIFFTVLGVLLTLDNLDIIDAGRVLRFWPVVLIVVGVLNLNHAGRRGLSIVAIALGTLMVAARAHLLRFSLFDLWPLLLIGAGLLIVLRAFGVSAPVQRSSLWSVLNTRKVTIDPDKLHGSQIISFMGGSTIELTNTGEHEGPVVVEVLAMWGGIEIRVPSGWEVIAEAVPVMGGIDIKTVGAPGGKQLVVRGLVFMAGMEIKNVRTS